MTGIKDWLKQQAEAAEDEHVRPEIRELVRRGNVTPAEVAELRCNSWEWEALVPAMTDEAFAARVEHALSNCAVRKRPFSTYDEAVAGLYAPELLKRFQVAARGARDYGQTIDNVREALGQKATHYLVVADDVQILVKALEWYATHVLELGGNAARARLALALVRGNTVNTTCEACGKKLVVELASRPEDESPLVLCAECGGGCTALPIEEVLPT